MGLDISATYLHCQTRQEDVASGLGRHGRLFAARQLGLHDADHGGADDLHGDRHDVDEHEHWCERPTTSSETSERRHAVRHESVALKGLVIETDE